MYKFDPINHVHTLDGKNLYGTTTILGVIAKPVLIQWAANQACEYADLQIEACMKETDGKPDLFQLKNILKEARTAHKRKKEQAGESGTQVHFEVENLVKRSIERFRGVIEPDIKSNIPQVQNFIDWAVNNNVKFLESEKGVYSRDMWVGGIADIVCEINGKFYVGDIKTSSGIYPEHFIQTSAYVQMLKEMGLYKDFYGVIIVNLKKDGTFKVEENYDLEGNLNCFKAALTLYKHLNAIDSSNYKPTKKSIKI